MARRDTRNLDFRDAADVDDNDYLIGASPVATDTAAAFAAGDPPYRIRFGTARQVLAPKQEVTTGTAFTILTRGTSGALAAGTTFKATGIQPLAVDDFLLLNLGRFGGSTRQVHAGGIMIRLGRLRGLIAAAAGSTPVAGNSFVLSLTDSSGYTSSRVHIGLTATGELLYAGPATNDVQGWGVANLSSSLIGTANNLTFPDDFTSIGTGITLPSDAEFLFVDFEYVAANTNIRAAETFIIRTAELNGLQPSTIGTSYSSASAGRLRRLLLPWGTSVMELLMGRTSTGQLILHHGASSAQTISSMSVRGTNGLNTGPTTTSSARNVAANRLFDIGLAFSTGAEWSIFDFRTRPRSENFQSATAHFVNHEIVEDLTAAANNATATAANSAVVWGVSDWDENDTAFLLGRLSNDNLLYGSINADSNIGDTLGVRTWSVGDSSLTSGTTEVSGLTQELTIIADDDRLAVSDRSPTVPLDKWISFSRLWSWIVSQLRGGDRVFYANFATAATFNISGANTDRRGSFTITTETSGAPNFANGINPPALVDGTTYTIAFGASLFDEDGETYQTVTAADLGLLAEGVPFDPLRKGIRLALGSPSSRTSAGAGNGAYLYYQFTAGVTGTLPAGATWRFTEAAHLSLDFLISVGHVYGLAAGFARYLLDRVTGTRTDARSYLRAKSATEIEYADPLLPLTGHDGDRFYGRSAVAPGDNLWGLSGGGGHDGFFGVHSNATGTLDDSNVYSNWTDIGAGRRQFWFAKRDYPHSGGVSETVTQANASGFVRAVNIDQGGGELILSNPGTVTSVNAPAGSGGAGYWVVAFDVAIDGVLTGNGVNIRFHTVATSRVAVELPYSSLRGVPSPWGIARRIRPISSAYNLTLQEMVIGTAIVCTGTSGDTILLPNDPPPGLSCIIANTSSAAWTLDGNGTDTVDGSATKSLAAGETVELMATGQAAWVTWG